MSVALESLAGEAKGVPAAAGAAAAMVKFIAVGGGAFVVFVLVSSVLISLQTGAPDWMINAGCYGAMIGPVYLLHRRFSFRSDAAHRQALPRYLAVQACGIVLASVFSFLIEGYLALPTVFASTLVMGLTVGVNFMVLRGWAFRQRQLAPLATP